MTKSIFIVMLLGLFLSWLIPGQIHDFFIFSSWVLAWGIYSVIAFVWISFLASESVQQRIIIAFLALPKPVSYGVFLDHALTMGLSFMLGYYYLAAFVGLISWLNLLCFKKYWAIVDHAGSELAAHLDRKKETDDG